MIPIPPLAHCRKERHYRIIPSVYPTINFFEDLVDPDEMEALWIVESLTNDRLRQETGDIFLVPSEDKIAGPGSSVVMAAFTHIGRHSRFTDGTFGVYYASFTPETAIRETVFHREKFLAATAEEPCELVMRMYEGHIAQPLHDVRSNTYHSLHHPDDYRDSQAFGRQLRADKSWGLVYRSVRDEGGTCIAAFRPRAITIPMPTSHFKYIWNGSAITTVMKIEAVMAIT